MGNFIFAKHESFKLLCKHELNVYLNNTQTFDGNFTLIL